MKTKIVFLVLLCFSFSLIQAQEKKTAIAKTNTQYVGMKQAPALVNLVKPVYPETAKKKKLEGLVVVQVLIGTDGKVKDTKILKSDNEIFNNSALEAAKNSTFSAGIKKDGKPAEAWAAIPFRFKLNKEKQ